ncbi:molybdenum ABC transporter ATP-binding protein [Candidatus Methylocalor cossyra]|uniref:Molybdenum import ATP-binding protein ModC n=1 Tax=Candidatus Methylocalor cossyra TaxID=3108543 RepID=A0ABM9NIF4_9GAMM
MLSLDVELQRGRFRLAARLDLDDRVTGLFGPSGSGKSTLLGLIAGLVPPDRGRIVLDGDTLYDSAAGTNLPIHRRRIGLVFQDSQLFPHYSVKGNLLFGFRLTPARERRFRFDDIVELLALRPLLKAHPRHISGGERQRVALGRSLLASPRLLLLDEPLASLDQGLKAQILPFLKRIRDELALPMIFVSHALPEVLYLTDRLALIDRGCILAHGALDAILRRAEPGSVALLGTDNLLAVTVTAHDPEDGCTLGQFRGLRLALPLRPCQAIGSTAYVAVHRGEVALSRRAVPETSIGNQLPGRIVRIESQGTRVLVHVDAGAPLIAEITPRAARELALCAGDPIWCLIKTRSFTYLVEPNRGRADLGIPP